VKLDLSCTENTATHNGMLSVSEVDLGQLRPSHPVLVVDRAECDLDADSSLTIPPEILHVKVVDGDKIAHFHIRVGVKKGRAFVDVCGHGRNSSTDRKKKAQGAWLPKLSV